MRAASKIAASLLAGWALSATSPAAAAPGYMSGNDLLKWCRFSPDTVEGFPCATYVGGIVDAYMMRRVAVPKESPPFCVRVGVTMGQVAEVVGAYLNAHPENRDFNAALLVMAALNESYPCSAPAQ